MVDIVLDSAELTVLGGPSEVAVQVDIGATGTRGSIFVVGTSEPNSITSNNVISGITVQIFDMYIDTLTRKMYQYVAGDGGSLSWVETVTIIPNFYAVNKSVDFSNGSGSIDDIMISNIVDSTFISGLGPENFSVQISISGSNPIASSVTVLTPSNGLLPITVKAAEFDGTTWSQLNGQKTVYVLITVV